MGNKWNSVSKLITLPDFAQGASQIDLFMEGSPGTAAWRIDDISVVGEGGGPTTGTTTTVPNTDCSSVFGVENEEEDSWHGLLTLSVIEDTISWKVVLNFDKEVTSVETPLGDISGSGASWTIDNKGFDGELNEGDIFELRFEVYFSGKSPDVIGIIFNNDELCEGEVVPTTSPPDDDCSETVVIESEDEGKWHGLIVILPSEDATGWEIELKFNHNVESLV